VLFSWVSEKCERKKNVFNLPCDETSASDFFAIARTPFGEVEKDRIEHVLNSGII